MPVSPADTIDLARAIGKLYEDAEDALFSLVSQALAEGIESPHWARAKLLAIGDLRRALEDVTRALQRDATGAISRAVEEAYRRGGQAAVAELGALPEGHRAYTARHLPGAAQADRLARATVHEQGPTYQRILRDAQDVYRSVVARVSGAPLLGALTRRQAAQRAMSQFAQRGITSFVDVRGRRWEMASYAEMAVRSVTARAAITGHVDQLTALGEQLVIVSDAPLECPLCRPWEGEVLAINGQAGPHTLRLPHAIQPGGLRGLLRPPETVVVHVAGSLTEARAAGLFHPNAILGNQQCRALGDVENAARAWYEGPSIHLTTARGNRLTVSPNHPVLTTAGWLAAERIREGMHVLSRPSGEREGFTPDAVEQLHDAPTSFEEVFDAVAAHGYRTSVTAAADDFHGDGRSYKGEVDVVWAEGALLNVAQSLGVQQLGELVLARPGMELEPFAGGGALLQRGHRVAGPVAGTLPDLDAVGLEAAPQRRLADAEDVGEILAGLACGVTPDQVVNVERGWYAGHAYDLQTETGAYLTDGIIVHNCRHNISVYLPGVTTRPQSPPHPRGATYEDTQRQRYYERQVRAWKRRAAAALDDQARRAANQRVRAYQARIRQHIADTGLQRRPDREQIGAAR